MVSERLSLGREKAKEKGGWREGKKEEKQEKRKDGGRRRNLTPALTKRRLAYSNRRYAAGLFVKDPLCWLSS